MPTAIPWPLLRLLVGARSRDFQYTPTPLDWGLLADWLELDLRPDEIDPRSGDHRRRADVPNPSRRGDSNP